MHTFVSNYFFFVVTKWYLFLITSTMWNDLDLHYFYRTWDKKDSIVVKSTMNYLDKDGYTENNVDLFNNLFA